MFLSTVKVIVKDKIMDYFIDDVFFENSSNYVHGGYRDDVMYLDSINEVLVVTAESYNLSDIQIDTWEYVGKLLDNQNFNIDHIRNYSEILM